MLISAFFFTLLSQTDATMLYNGLQKAVLSPNISSQCNSVMNVALSCPDLIQLTAYPIQESRWNTTGLTELCTSNCNETMHVLDFGAQLRCSNDTFVVDNRAMSIADLVNIMWYKWDLICLEDASTGDFCLDVEASWNITTMVAEGKATWPNNTQKCYLDSAEGEWQYYTDENGTCIDPPWMIYQLPSVFETQGDSDMAAFDYYTGTPDAVEDDNYGWTQALDYDEYPLEIQCSSCSIQKFKHAYEKTWGSAWDEITEQVWANMKKNCGLDDDLIPAHNVSGVIHVGDPVASYQPITTNCPQNLTIPATEKMTCLEAAAKFGIAYSGLVNLNNGIWDCSALSDVTICAPMSCPIMVVDLTSTGQLVMGVNEFVQTYTNLTMASFYSYNYYLSQDFLTQGETVCIGPAIQIYQPSS